MALERTGLSSVLTFDEKSAVTSMGNATSAFKGLDAAANKGQATVMVSAEKLRAMSQSSSLLGGNLASTARGFSNVAGAARKMGSFVSRAGVALSNMGRAMGFAALATAPFAAGLAHGASEWAKFEDAMADIKSADPFNTKGLDQAREASLRLGRSTKFSAVEVGQAMAGMRKAGLDMTDVLATIEPTTTLAVAGDSNLATASKMLTKLLVQTGTSADDAQVLIDKIGVAAAGSTATLPEMAQALSYVGGTAHDLGVNVDQTLVAIGAIGAAGKEGSRAGRGLDIALSDLIKGYSKLGQPLRVTKEGQLDLFDTTKLLNMELDKQVAHLPKHSREMARNALINKQFSQNSARAFRALSSRMNEMEAQYKKVHDQSAGFAGAMAQVQLDTPIGQFTRLKNAVETVGIQGFELALKGLLPELTKFADFVGGVGATMAFLNLKSNDTTEEAAKIRKEFRLASPTAQAFGKGIKMAADSINDTLKNLENAFERVKTKLESVFGPESTANIVSFAAQFAVALGVLSPFLGVASLILIAMGSFVSAIGAMISAVGGLEAAGTLLMGGFLIPLGTALLWVAGIVGVGLLAFAAYKKEGESVTDALARLWTDAISPLIDGFEKGFAPAIDMMGKIFTVFAGIAVEALGYLTDAFSPLVDAIFGTRTDMHNLGETVGKVFGYIAVGASLLAGGISFLISSLVAGLSPIIKFLMEYVVDTIKQLTLGIFKVVDGFDSLFNGNIQKGLEDIGEGIKSMLMAPIAKFIREIAHVMTLAHLTVPDDVKKFLAELDVEVKPPPPPAPAAAAAKAGAEAENQKSFSERNAQALADIFATQPDKNVNVTLKLENRTIREVNAKFEKELNERAAEKSTPWGRRMIAEQGSVSVK